MVQTFHIKQSQPSNTSSANNAQLAKTILQTTAFICKAGQIHFCLTNQQFSVFIQILHFVARFRYQPWTQCKIGQTHTAKQSFQFSIWPEQFCKPVIKIGQTQSANQWFQFSIWPEQVCKPVDMSSNQWSSSSFFILHITISHLSVHFGYQPSNALFILHQSSHTLLL